MSTDANRTASITCVTLAAAIAFTGTLLGLYIFVIQLPEPSPTTEELLATVPLGISVKELPEHARSFKVNSGHITTPNPDTTSEEEPVSIADQVDSLRDYDKSHTTVYLNSFKKVERFINDEVPEDFTGKIRLFRDIQLNTYEMTLFFVDGKLVEKDWNILPG